MEFKKGKQKTQKEQNKTKQNKKILKNHLKNKKN